MRRVRAADGHRDAAEAVVSDLRHERSACRPIGYDGMHETEREVMRLFDAGAGTANIVRATGLSVGQIQRVTSRLAVTALEPWTDAAHAGSDAPLAALPRLHPATGRASGRARAGPSGELA